MRFRAEVRARWLGMVGVALLVGIAGGAVFAAGAGARRTDSTLGRVVRAQRIPDLLVNPDASDQSPAFLRAYAKVDTLPEVATVTDLSGVAAAPVDAEGRPDLEAVVSEIGLAASDKNLIRKVDRPHLVAGRFPNVDRADEVMINRVKARRAHLAVGDRLHLGIFAMDDFTEKGPLPKARFVVDETVVGVVEPLDDATRAPDDPGLISTVTYTPAFARRLAGINPSFVGKEVVLRRGAADVPAFEAGVRRAFLGVKVNQRGRPAQVNMNFQEPNLTIARARRAVRPYVLALWLFAALAAIAAIAVVGQAVGRGMRPLREDASSLAALGFTRRQLVQCAALRGLAIGALGVVIAILIAVLASPAMPIGPLRRSDPVRGVRFDALVLLAGAAVLVTLVVLAAVVAMRRRRAPNRPASVAVGDRLAAAGAPVTLVSGVRFALDRGRDRGVPLRSTLVGITIAVAALVATLVYAAGLTQFTSSPPRYGWPWSYQVIVDSAPTSEVAARLGANPAVDGFAAGAFSQFEIAGRSVAAVGIDRAPGVPFLPPLTGRAPSADDEIVLGAKTMRAAHAQIGRRIQVRAQNRVRDFLVVGSAVFPRLAPYPGSEPTGLGIGAATTQHAVRALNAQVGAPFFVVQAKRNARLTVDALVRDAGAGSDSGLVVGPQRPNDVLSYDRLSRTPMLLAGVLVLLAIGSAVHLLVTGVRSRRRDVALLKTFGFTGRQSRGAVLVQATVLVGIALVCALPLGLLAGRWLWMETAHWLGIAPDPAIPVVALTAVVIVSLVLANVIAIGPASLAARIRPAIALRSE